MIDSKRSDDPRIRRLDLTDRYEPLSPNEEWITFEVFHQKKRGDQPVHVGIVHAPNHELALVFAKEQFARRMPCVNLWVVKTTDVYTFRHEDEDMFASATSEDKKYREASGFTVRERINRYKKEYGIK